MNEIIRMKKYLPLLRATVGYSQADVARKLNVTRSHISNLEKPDTKMTRMQYLAIYKVFEYEMDSFECFDDTMMTRVLLTGFVKCEDWFEYDDDIRDEVYSMISMLSGQYGHGKTIEKANKYFIEMMKEKGLESYLVTEE